MEAEHGAAVDVMWQLKNALDPLNILNPGKILPAHAGFAATAAFSSQLSHQQ
jgi:D-lactate dehydrogenase (cytochrome)